jgi:hypothetical protein
MIAHHSAIRRLFAPKKTLEERTDASVSARFVTRLGDVKVETKEMGHTDVLDGPAITDRFAS